MIESTKLPLTFNYLSADSRQLKGDEILQVKALAESAALAFPSLKIIGWDICISDRGPLIIEGNSSPGLALIQKPHLGGQEIINALRRGGAYLR
jgi:D-alanine-D-alanine ligase-like ATP-grasp enzyme